jgi:alkylation response protein AidB-like acyl-CoA dehydrogenase
MSDSALEAFRAETRAWLEANCPPEMREPVRDEDDVYWGGRNATFKNDAQKAWFEVCRDKGYTVPAWPKDYGGAGLSPAEAKVLREEMTRIGARPPLSSFGIWMLGPALLHFGTEGQKQRFLNEIARGEIRWCQGYSEPNAGSDLANLQTFAEDKGDHYLVNGQKTWTSGGQWADKCFAIVRTDKSDKHKGISFMLIDMDTPGVEVRPITMISGTSPFCETFFTDVKVPKENLVGEEGQGWTIGKRLLQHERTNISGGGSLARLMGQSLGDIAKKYQPTGADGELADAVLRDKIADFEIRWNSFLLTARRAMEESKAAGGVSEISSVLKKLGTKLSQERSELLIEIRGLQGLGWEGDGFSDGELGAVRAWLFGKATTIYGGSTEIQNNIIAKRVLGMLDHQ